MGPAREADRGRRPGHRALVLAFGMALAWTAVPMAGLDPAPEAGAAGAATTMGATLPGGRAGSSAVWNGTHAFVFGGSNGGAIDEIVRYDPVRDQATLLASRLPGGRAWSSAVFDGTSAYVFGGFNNGYLAQIVRFTPATGAVAVMGAALPSGRAYTSAVWDGQFAYVFGGQGISQVVRYDPATDTVRVMGADFGTGLWRTSAAWSGRVAYIFGGAVGSLSGSANTNQILRYDPATDRLTTMGAEMPEVDVRAFESTAAVWDGKGATIVGRTGCGPGCPAVTVRYLPEHDRAYVRCVSLPSERYEASAVWDGRDMYVFGGQMLTSWGASGAIVRLPAGTNCPPVAAIASLEPAECVDGRATVTLDGSPSHDSDGDPITFAWEAPGIAFDDPASPRPTATFPFGTTGVALTVRDPASSGAAGAGVPVVDTLPPVVALARPARGLYVLDREVPAPAPPAQAPSQVPSTVAVGGVTAVATASDLCGMAGVRFTVSDGSGATVTGPPYTHFVDPLASYVTRRVAKTLVHAIGTDLGGHAVDVAVEFAHVPTRPPPPAPPLPRLPALPGA